MHELNVRPSAYQTDSLTPVIMVLKWQIQESNLFSLRSEVLSFLPCHSVNLPYWCAVRVMIP